MTTIYEQEPSGSIRLKPGRRAWGVDIPAYVYDLWVPLIGYTAIGLYGMLCRLERDGGKIKGLTLKDLATYGRVGIDKLNQMLGMLETCGFLAIEKPTSWQKLAHYTTVITTLDAPAELSAEVIKLWGVGGDKWEYRPLANWLVEQVEELEQTDPKTQIGFSGNPDGSSIKNPDGFSNIEPYVPSVSTSPLRARGNLENIPAAVLYPPNPPPAEQPVAAFDHPLVQFFMEQTGLRSLTKTLTKLLNEPIKVKTEDGFSTISGGLVGLWDNKAGYEVFCRERIPATLSWSIPMTPENILKHLRNVDKADGKVKGFYAWAEAHPELCRTREDKAGSNEPIFGPEFKENW